MDPLSITASVITVLQAAEAVISICCDYRSAVKGSSWELSRVLEEVRALRNVLRTLEELADKAESPSSDARSRLPALKSLCDPDTGILNKCRTELNNLTTKLTPPEWIGPSGSKRRGLVQALTWPLRKEDTEKALAGIERFKSTINVVVATDQTTSILAIHDNTQDIQTSLSSIYLDTHRQQVLNWLRATDPSSKFYETLKDRQPGTGSWFTNSRVFSKWVHDPNSLLWLHGIPGCGKTVLCSTAIERVLQLHSLSTQKRIGIAYFYFDFKCQDQQVCDAMLRSLVTQLSLQSLDAFKVLDALYSACGSGTSQPSLTMSLKALKDIAEIFTDVFILVDALDECKQPAELLANVENLVTLNIASLHMLVTSRREKEIEDSMSTLLDDEHKLCIRSTLVKDDIRAYVQGRICKDRRLQKWQKPEIHAEIEEVLVGKADGMFQWVKCQLDALRNCLSISDLRKALRSLPKDLDDTYARILQNIVNKGYGNQVATILQWLAYSVVPLSLNEIVDVLTVDMESDPLVDFERRLQDPQDLLEVCSSLVSIRPRNPWEKESLQFAHFSVREFLESPRLYNGPLGRFALDKMRANILIAESCIAYSIHLDSPQISRDRLVICEDYPLDSYAANNWGVHARNARENGRIISLCERLLRSDRPEMPAWLGIFNDYHYFRDSQGRFLPLHYAVRFSLPRIMRKLILEGAHVNPKDERGATPLMWVASSHHERVEDLQFLLDHGAEVNAQSDFGSTALVYASEVGFIQITRILLDNGAAMDTQNLGSMTALAVASAQGNVEIVRLLLDRGASISSPNGSKALVTACSFGRYEIVQILLNRGVDVNAECDVTILSGDFSGTALSRALSKGPYYSIAELLLKYGADVNAQVTLKRRHGVALEHVLAWVGSNPILESEYTERANETSQLDERIIFLLENGADPKLVNTENLDYKARKLYDKVLNERSQKTKA